MSRNDKQGFSLIELMIVIAIIGILAAIAVPAYSDYVVRSKVSEILSVSNGVKNAVAEYRIVNNDFPTTLALSGAEDPSGFSDMVSSATVARTSATEGVITLVGDATNLGLGALTLSIVLTGTYTNGGIKWACTSTGTGTKYAPASCR